MLEHIYVCVTIFGMYYVNENENWSMHSFGIVNRAYVVKNATRTSHTTHSHKQDAEKGAEKHENEIIEIKMVLNITHGATTHIRTVYTQPNGCC